MKVALIGLYWRGRGGATTSAITYWPALRKWGIDAEFIVMSGLGKPKVSEPIQDVIPVTHVKFKEAANYINENFDGVHFWTMGNTSDKQDRHLDILENIELPWMCSIRAPNDFKRYKNWETMLNTGNWRGAHFISELLRAHAIDKYPKYFSKENTVAAECTIDPSRLEVASPYRKEKLVVQHTRVASIKRPHILVNYADKLYNAGIEKIRIYGRCEYWSYQNQLEELDNYPIVDWEGAFELYQLPAILRPAMFDFDLTDHGPHDGGRPQNTTLEAMLYGAIPVIQKQWCNEHMQDMKHVIAFDPQSPDDVVSKVKEVVLDSRLYSAMVANNRDFVPFWYQRSKRLPDFYRSVLK